MSKPHHQQKRQQQQPVAYAPVPQEMHDRPGPSWEDVQALRASIEAREADLLAAQQQLLLLACRAGGDDQLQQAGGADDEVMGAAGDVVLQRTERALLLARYQCLLEEKRQLTAMMRLAGRLHDLEPGPGETPMRDVTCSVITHQLDTPCLSCCFQR